MLLHPEKSEHISSHRLSIDGTIDQNDANLVSLLTTCSLVASSCLGQLERKAKTMAKAFTMSASGEFPHPIEFEEEPAAPAACAWKSRAGYSDQRAAAAAAGSGSAASDLSSSNVSIDW